MRLKSVWHPYDRGRKTHRRQPTHHRAPGRAGPRALNTLGSEWSSSRIGYSGRSLVGLGIAGTKIEQTDSMRKKTAKISGLGQLSAEPRLLRAESPRARRLPPLGDDLGNSYHVPAFSKRAGFKKTRVALARKMAVVLHRMWVDGTDFGAQKPDLPGFFGPRLI